MRIRTIILAALLVAMLALTACGTKDTTEEATKVTLEGTAAEYFKISEDNFEIEEVIGLLVTVKAELIKNFEGEEIPAMQWTLTLKDEEGNVIEDAEDIAINQFGYRNFEEMLAGALNTPTELKFNIEVDNEASQRIKDAAASAVLSVNFMEVEEEEVLPDVEDEKQPEKKPVAKPTTPTQKPVVNPDRPQKPVPAVPSEDIDGKLTAYNNAVDRYLGAKNNAKPGDPKAQQRIEKERANANGLGSELAGKVSSMTSAQKTRYDQIKAKMN
ncbi:MAG: hypothetical protein WCY21_01800 [Candidatus Cloacimonadaceae bacterium]|jgi:hypothetical protein|nr:hypothetical protein [Candidatus Cloacimonadota bacterium]MDX9949895.1 hypothetical protein [Candidatus Syntrophosphaera sp.]